jgi:tetratricopeptide (TPR) repeat protein
LNRPALLVLVVVTFGARASGPADDHLLAGADHFRAGRFNEALVEFRAARKLDASADAAWYVAACLAKLKRAEEAVEVFSQAENENPTGRDVLLEYYRALACYDAKLYLCADKILARIGASSGTRIAGQARKIRGDIAALLSKEPSTESLDWYHERAAEVLKAGRTELALAYYEEVAALAGRQPSQHRRQEALAAAARVRQMARANMP